MISFLKRSELIRNLLKKLKMTLLQVFIFRFKKVGKNFYTSGKITILSRNVFIGDNVRLGHYCHIGVSPLTLEDNVLIAPRVSFIGGDHIYDKIGVLVNETGLQNYNSIKVKLKQKGIRVSKDVWIGYGVTIFDGVKIGEGAIIGAGSIVTNNIEPYSVNIGVPSKKIKMRFHSKNDMIKHSKLINGEYWKKH